MAKFVLVLTSGQRPEVDDTTLEMLLRNMGQSTNMWAPFDVGGGAGADRIVPAHVTRIIRTG